MKLSRRQVLALGVAGAGGAAAVRFAAFPSGGGHHTSAPKAVAAGADPPNPLAQPRILAAHLLRRAGFTYSAADLDAAAAMPYADLVDKVVSTAPDPLTMPAQLGQYNAVVVAWYGHMATTAAQFPERMTLFWHGLLTSDYRKAAGLPFVAQQNVLYRQKGTTDFRTLLNAVTADPLMMRYLDLYVSTGKAPNENYSRELMELFTLGVGNFTEDDVREGARALSGMRIVFTDASGTVAALPKPPKVKSATVLQQYYQQIATMIGQGYSFTGRLVPRLHDSGTKTYLGRTGNLGPEDVIDAILAQDSCAPYIATKALEYFATPNPSKDLVASVASTFRSSGYDIKSMMRAIFSSADFQSAANYRSLVRSPVDYMVSTMRVLGRPELARQCTQTGQYMDQILYDMPTVGGWPVNAGWVSSGSLLARINFAALVARSTPNLPDPATAVADQLDGVVGADTAAVFNASHTTADKWFALLASPEFQLK